MEESRKIEILRNNKWVESKFAEIVNGDIFRMFEPTGAKVIDEDGNTNFRAVSEVYSRAADSVLTVNVVSEPERKIEDYMSRVADLFSGKQ